MLYKEHSKIFDCLKLKTIYKNNDNEYMRGDKKYWTEWCVNSISGYVHA